jgi:tRNA U34 5-methylaminomethyl-2-thiouridine-forming methyltransferase MnmC
MIKLVTTSDGSHTIYVPELNEHYHSIHGAIQESTFIFINNGFDFCKADPVNIFEVGFGTGLNAFLTAIRAKTGKREVSYSTIEKFTLDENTTKSLNYQNFAGEDDEDIFSLLHSSSWNTDVTICKNFILRKISGDLTIDVPSGRFDLVYFDAFGPDKQPEMWTKEIFSNIASVMIPGGILVTYSSKGEVKRNLRSCGFDVELLPGPPGKRQIIRAIKK